MVQAEKMVSTRVLNILRCTLMVMTGPKSKVADRPSNAGDSGTTGTAEDRKGKKRAAKEDNGPLPKKRKQYKSREFVESENEDVLRAGCPSAGSSLRDASVQPEASKVSHNLCYRFNFRHSWQVCDACKSRRSQCVWASRTEGSQSQNEKRACAACVSQKTRCHIAGESGHAFLCRVSWLKEHPGVFSIRRPRGKAAVSQQAAPPGKVYQLRQSVTELRERTIDLEKKLSWDDEENQRLLSRVASLEHQISLLRANFP